MIGGIPMGDIIINLGKKLKKAREQNRLSQKDVAKYLNVNEKQISYYENGSRKVNIVILTKLADLYGYPISYFLESNDQNIEPEIKIAYRMKDLGENDLNTVAWAKNIAKNLNFLNKILEDQS